MGDRQTSATKQPLLVAVINEWLWPRGRSSLQLTLCRGADGPATFSQPSMLIRTGTVDEEVWSTCAGAPSS